MDNEVELAFGSGESSGISLMPLACRRTSSLRFERLVDKVGLPFLAVPVDGGKPLSFHMIEIFIFNPGGELVNFKFDQRGECV